MEIFPLSYPLSIFEISPLTYLAILIKEFPKSIILLIFVDASDWLDFLAVDPLTRSNTSVCLKITDPVVASLPAEGQAAFAKALAKRLETEGAALDVGAYRDAPPGLRIWTGGTVETSDLADLMPWLTWAFEAEKAEL